MSDRRPTGWQIKLLAYVDGTALEITESFSSVHGTRSVGAIRSALGRLEERGYVRRYRYGGHPTWWVRTDKANELLESAYGMERVS